MTKHGIQATSDPNFKPDPNYVHVYDEEARVWRKTHIKDVKGSDKVTETFNVNLTVK